MKGYKKIKKIIIITILRNEDWVWTRNVFSKQRCKQNYSLSPNSLNLSRNEASFISHSLFSHNHSYIQSRTHNSSLLKLFLLEKRTFTFQCRVVWMNPQTLFYLILQGSPLVSVLNRILLRGWWCMMMMIMIILVNWLTIYYELSFSASSFGILLRTWIGKDARGGGYKC